MNVTELGGLFASLTGKSEEELRNQLDQIMQDAEDDDTAKSGVSKFLEDAFSAKFKSISEQQLNRGIRESREALERKLKSQYELTTNAKGEELIAQIVELERQAAAKQASTNLEELSADQLKGLPQVQEMVKPWVSKYEQVQQEFESFKTNLSKQQRASQVREAIRREFISLNPILPTDEAKKQKAIEAFVNSFNPEQFDIADTGEIKPLGSNGNPLQDDKYNEVRLSDFVKANNYFDVHRQDPTKASPQPNAAAPAQGQSGTFQSRSELLKFMNDPNVPTAKKKAAYEAFQTQNAK